MKASSNDRGAVAVETALIVAVLLVPLLIGIIDITRLIHTHIIVTEAAQEGVLYVAYNEGATVDAPATENHVEASVGTPSWENFQTKGDCTFEDRKEVDGSLVEFTVTADVDLFFPFFGNIVTLEKTATGHRFFPCHPTP